MAIATAQITIVDDNDFYISTTAPASPTANPVWLDTSVTPNQLKRWNGTAWIIVNDTAGLSTLITTAQTTADRKRTIFTVTPTTPYIIGDLFVSTAANGDNFVCTTTLLTGAYNAAHWTKDSSTQRVKSAEDQIALKVASLDFASLIEQNPDSVKIGVGQIGTNNAIYNSSADFQIDSPQTFVYSKIPNGANFDYRWVRMYAVAPGVELGNFNIGSTLTTWFSKPTAYGAWDFWKLKDSTEAALFTGRAVGDIMFSDTARGSFSAGDWDWDIDDADAKFLINDTYGAYPKIDLLGQTDDKMVAFHQAGTPRTEHYDIADNAAYNEFVGDLWLDSDATPASLKLPTSWRGTLLSLLDTANGYLEGSAFKLTGGVNDEYFISQDRITALPSKHYTLQGAIRAVGLAGTGAQFELIEYNSAGAYLTSHLTGLQTGTAAYAIKTVSFISHASAKYFKVKMTVNAYATPAGYALFDRLKLEDGDNISAWRSSENEMRSGTFEVTDKYARFKSQDGSYTEFDPADSGLTHHKSGVSRDYHYLVEIGRGSVYNETSGVKVVITDTAFRGKEFTVMVSLALVGKTGTGDWLNQSKVWIASTDVRKGEFYVSGYSWTELGTGPVEYTWIAVC